MQDFSGDIALPRHRQRVLRAAAKQRSALSRVVFVGFFSAPWLADPRDAFSAMSRFVFLGFSSFRIVRRRN
jgi:hypothetical protein